MTLQSSGPIDHQDIEDEFGGSHPISMDEYYGAGGSAPSSGEISMSDFYGLSNVVPWNEWNSSSNSFTGYAGPTMEKGDFTQGAGMVLGLDDTRFLCLYSVTTDANLRAVVYTISGQTIESSGSYVELDASSSFAYTKYNVNASLIDSNTVAVCYYSDPDMTVRILSIDNQTITMGTAYDIAVYVGGDIFYNGTNLIFAGATDAENYLYVQILTFSGTSITGAGTAYINTGSSMYSRTIIYYGSSYFGVQIDDGYNGNYQYMFSFSGTSVTYLNNYLQYYYAAMGYALTVANDYAVHFGSLERLDFCDFSSHSSLAVTVTESAKDNYGDFTPGDRRSLVDGQFIMRVREGTSTSYEAIEIYSPTTSGFGSADVLSVNFRPRTSTAYTLSYTPLGDNVLVILRHSDSSTGATELIVVPSYP